MEFKGTKAPWVVATNICFDGTIEIEQENGLARIANTPMNDDACRADAQLISAAPELLEVAKFLVENFDPQKAWMIEEFEKAKTAINKALNKN